MTQSIQNVRIRRISEDDWDGIAVLEAGVYGPMGLSEERAALESKVWASPTTCFALDWEQRLAGYLLALPYPEFDYPDLARSEEVVFHSRNLHLHDLVIAEDLRGRGLGRRLLHQLTARARQQGYEQISLVAVGGSHTFWSANGFAVRHAVAGSEGYGASSVYMSMVLPSEQAEDASPVGGLLSGAPSRDEVG